jgi:hypothetical protein
MLAQASTAYLKWVPVQAPVSSGATCGNGTPFHFFVNRAIGTRKTLIYFEGGGACWQQRECLGKGKFSEVATNPNGVPANYFSQINLAAFGLVSPMIWRLSPLNRTVTQSWNLVYVPYCTGDVHTGNAVGVYGDQTPSSPLTYYHRGHVHAQQVAVADGRAVAPDGLGDQVAVPQDVGRHVAGAEQHRDLSALVGSGQLQVFQARRLGVLRLGRERVAHDQADHQGDDVSQHGGLR